MCFYIPGEGCDPNCFCWRNGLDSGSGPPSICSGWLPPVKKTYFFDVVRGGENYQTCLICYPDFLATRAANCKFSDRLKVPAKNAPIFGGDSLAAFDGDGRR